MRAGMPAIPARKRGELWARSRAADLYCLQARDAHQYAVLFSPIKSYSVLCNHMHSYAVICNHMQSHAITCHHIQLCSITCPHMQSYIGLGEWDRPVDGHRPRCHLPSAAQWISRVSVESSLHNSHGRRSSQLQVPHMSPTDNYHSSPGRARTSPLPPHRHHH